MSAQADQVFTPPPGKYLVDTYEDWAQAEGAPIYRGSAIDLLDVETKTWPRFGVRGALCHLDGRCDFLTIFLLELAPGASSAPQRHLYEEMCFVLTGNGETEITGPDGTRQKIEWGPGSLFAAPMNAQYQHRCSGKTPARIVAINDLRYLMNLYRNERFIFETPLTFPERGEGEIAHDLTTLALPHAAASGERAASLALANGSIGADIVELPTGVYGRARRQMFGALLFGVSGQGMTLSWPEGAQSPNRTDWKLGTVFAPTGLLFHQQFNVGATPARYLRVELGSSSYPMLRPRKHAYGDKTVYASGAAEIDAKDESPALRRVWLDELAKNGVSSQM